MNDVIFLMVKETTDKIPHLRFSLNCFVIDCIQYFGHLMQRADSLKRTLMLGKIEAKREGDS